MSRILRGSLPVLLAATGCDAPLSIFSRASDSAARISTLGWFMIILSGVIYIGVMAAMVAAMLRNRRRNPADVDLTERSVGWIVWGGAVMPAIALLATFVVGVAAMGRYPEPRPAVTIRVTAKQWWWQLDYEVPGLPNQFRTANEIHIPVGKSARLLLASSDVIHSFWVPRLQGKLDVIPGETNDLRLLARKPGTYSGACAEFCGTQHAHLGLVVVAEDWVSFAQWGAHELTDGAAPHDSITLMGQRLFVTGPCALCHAVRGTPARAEIGPDLTHVGGRASLAAGTLRNTLGNLAGWIANAQSLKPGSKMPTMTMYSGAELRALATYVESLK